MASDKNLYRGIRLGRIVNSNGRVIGSIVKKRERKKKRAPRYEESAWDRKRQKREKQENGMGSKMEGTRGGLGCLHNFLS